VVGFVLEHTRFKSQQERDDMRAVFDRVGVRQA